MASLLPVVQNENQHIRRGKGFDASLTKLAVQNENSYVNKGKGLGKAKADVPKQSKGVGQERKALSDLKQAKAASQERRALRDLTNATNTKPSLKDKSTNPSRGTAKKAIVRDVRIGEWAAEGTEKMNFFDLRKFETSRLQDWWFSELFSPLPESPPSRCSEVPSDGEDFLKMELELEVLPPSRHRPHPDTILPSILGGDECLDLFSEDLYFNRANEVAPPLRLKEESELGESVINL